MLKSLRSLLRAPESANAAVLPDGQRVYALGDIHGRADLFAALIAAVDADDAARPAAQTTVILLGDLVDRGPDSAGVIRLAREWTARRAVRFLMGNHEEMFLEALESDEVLRNFLRYGGKETLFSYPIDQAAYAKANLAEVRAMAKAAVPAGDLDFIRSFEERIELGGYLFVHAGIRPEVALAEQRTVDTRWIRETFLAHRESFGHVVVHGHTIFDRPEVKHNRIGIDTGAYTTGRLTALGLQGTARWAIAARASEGAITVTTGELA